MWRSQDFPSSYAQPCAIPTAHNLELFEVGRRATKTIFCRRGCVWWTKCIHHCASLGHPLLIIWFQKKRWIHNLELFKECKWRQLYGIVIWLSPLLKLWFYNGGQEAFRVTLFLPTAKHDFWPDFHRSPYRTFASCILLRLACTIVAKHAYFYRREISIFQSTAKMTLQILTKPAGIPLAT